MTSITEQYYVPIRETGNNILYNSGDTTITFTMTVKEQYGGKVTLDKKINIAPDEYIIVTTECNTQLVIT